MDYCKNCNREIDAKTSVYILMLDGTMYCTEDCWLMNPKRSNWS